MKNIYTYILLVLVVLTLAACGGNDQATAEVEPTLSAELVKVIPVVTSRAFLNDQIVLNITEQSGEVVITNGSETHTISALNSILMEENFDAENPTLLTFVSMDDFQVCFIQREDGRMHAAYEHHIDGVECDPQYDNLIIEGKWEVLENVEALQIVEDYNVKMLIDHEPGNAQFTFTNQANEDQIFEIKLLSMVPKDDSFNYKYLVSFNGETVCTIEEYAEGGLVQSSISGMGDTCDNRSFNTGYEVTIPGYFNMK